MGEGMASPATPSPVYSNKHVLLPPSPLPGLWFGLNPSLQVRHPWGGGGQWKRVTGVGIGVPGRHVQTLYLSI